MFFDNYLYILNQSESFIGSKEELSELPNLLDSLITECKALEYKDNRIILSSGIDTNSFTQLNEILTKPILDFDTIPITELEVYPESDIKDKLESNRSDWNTIKERNSKFDSKEDYFDDESYLLSYTFPLNMDSRYYEYSDILTNYLKNFFDEKEFSDFRYNDRYVTFYGVIKRIFKEEPELIIETTFGVNRSPIISIHKSVYTSGNNIQDAFYNGLKEWLKLYGKDLVKEIKTEHNTV